MRLILTLSFLFLIGALNAQENGTITGRILDEDTKDPLIGVNIVSLEGQGTTTDLEGNFELSLTVGRHELVFTYIGYETINRIVRVKTTDNTPFYIDMLYESIEFDEIVVSGSRYAKRASEEVISIEVVKMSLADNTVAIRLDDLAKRVPGLTVSDGQASIRAGSGWSFSIGSRVNIVLDGQSLLTPDRSAIRWSYLPMENVGQIEVMKGASSILYGSSAMNGTIHLQTIKPRKEAESKFVAYAGFLDDYKNDDYNWWTKPRAITGGYFSRAHKVSDHFEYVVGFNANYSQLPYFQYTDYHIRTNLHTKWTSKKDNKSNYGFRLNHTYYQESEFIFWEGPDELALYPIDDLMTTTQSFNLDPFYTRYDKKNNKHLIQGRLYLYKPEGTRKGGFVNAEYQFNKRWGDGWSIVAGGLQDWMGFYDRSGFDIPYQQGFKWAMYAQVDKKFPKLSLTAGLRSEIFKITSNVGAAYAIVKNNESTGEVKEIPLPLMRFGLNYNPRKNTFVRFNLGQAFRLPSLTEYFIDFNFSGISILSNPDLRPEYGWTAEVGFKQNFQAKKAYHGSFDVAIFWQEYKDLIEFQPSISGGLALIPMNLPTARIAGYEVSLKQSVKSKQHRLNVEFGYTYAFPVELSGVEGGELKSVGNYIKSMFKYAGNISNTPESIQRDAILKYRNRHLVNLIFEYENDHFIIGMYSRYYSNIENGDFEFDTDLFSFIPGITDYWAEKFPMGDFIADVTMGVKLNKMHSLSLTIKNIGNREYSLRLGKIEPPRSFNWKYQYTF